MIDTGEIAARVAADDELYGPFTSTHEGFGVLAEEVAELLDAIHQNDLGSVRQECLDVAATALRIARSLECTATVERSGM